MTSSTISAAQAGRPTLLGRAVDRPSLAQVARVLALVATAALAAHFWETPESRAPVLMIAATVLWALDVVPDYVVALGVVVVWNIGKVGPSAASLSGFASPVWFLLLGVLAVGGGLARSGVLQRVAFTLLSLFPATFCGQVVAFLVGGLVITPFLPLTVARCALMAPLARQVAGVLGYPARSREAVGIGLAAFVGSGLLSRVFLSGATLNLIAWSLLPASARLGWWKWALAGAPMMLVVALGALGAILLMYRPADDRPIERDVIRRQRDASGPFTFREHAAGMTAVAVLIGFVAGPWLGIDGAWVACLGAMVLTLTGVLSREQFRQSIDWPLLVFLGVILGMPAMIHQAGVDGQLERVLPPLVAWAQGSPGWTLTVLFAIITAARFVLSEWVAVPLLTATLLPVAPAVGIHPWLVAFVVLCASNLWALPYQFASYLAFWSGSDGELFAHDQVRAFSIVYLVLSLGGILISIPVWRLLGFLSSP